MTRTAKLHKGRSWSVMRLPWTGFRDMVGGFRTREAAIEWATANGYAIVDGSAE